MAESDVVITTAVVPGKKAPVLVTAEMVKGMAPGSVIFDLAAERGGNCELTQIRQNHRRARGHHHRPHQYRDRSPLSRQPDVRAQCHRISFASGERRQAATQSAGRDYSRNLLTRDGEVVNQRVREFFKLPAWSR